MIFTIFLFFVAKAAAGFYANTPVVELTTKTFNQVYSDTNVWMVEFYAPWCGHCKNLTPAYIKAAKNLDGLVKMGAVDCDADENKQICSQFGVQGFPTLKTLDWDAKSASSASAYQGGRTAGGIASHLKSKVANNVMKLSDAKKADKFNAAGERKVVLFSEKKAVSFLYKALALQFKNRLVFGQATLEHDLAEQYSVTEGPTLVVLPETDEDEIAIYSGKLKPQAMAKFLSGYAPALKGAKKEKKAKKSEPEQPKTEPQTELWRLSTGDDYVKRCRERRGTCIIALVDPLADGYDSYIAVLNELVEKYSGGVFTFAWLDGYTQTEFVKAANLKGMDLPQVMAINDKKGAWDRYIGAFATAKLSKHLDKLQGGRAGVQAMPKDLDLSQKFIAEAKEEL